MALQKINAYPRPKKKLGQNFLVNDRIAEAEAVHGIDKNVLEMGPGYGILTRLLCKKAKRVVAVERDTALYEHLKHALHSKKLKLICSDFFDVSDEELELGDTDIMISNIPYVLSSKTIEWLSEKRMQAVLCLQKEFVEHMLAREGTDKYSKLSVISALSFSITKIMDVPKGNFRPMPKVDSAVIYMKPKDARITDEEMRIIGILMQHKKKTVRSSFIDSEDQLGITKEEAVRIADSLKHRESRLFKLSPGEILDLSREIGKRLDTT